MTRLLLAVLLLIAAAPVVAPALPAGPASLFAPRAAAVAAAGLAILFFVFVGPAPGPGRRPATVFAGSLERLLVAIPFVAGPALAGGASPPEIARAVAIVAGAALAAALWFAGPGRNGRRDRAFAAGAVLVLAGLPFGNWIANDFLGATGGTGYAVSPLLAARSVLLDRPGADATPCLLLLVAASAVFAGLGLGIGRRGVAAGLLLLLAAPARAAEVEPVLGDARVPGRVLWLRVAPNGAAAAEIEVEVPGRGIVRVPFRAGGALVPVPGAEGLERIRVREGGEWREVPLPPMRRAAPGRLAVALGPLPPETLRRVEGEGFTVARAAAGAEAAPGDVFLTADLVLDPANRRPDVPPTAGAAAARRPWEEAGRVLDPEGLLDLFPPPEGLDPARSRRSFLPLLLFAAAAFAWIRWGGRRSGGAAMRVGGIALLAAATLGTLVALLPRPPAVDRAVFTIREPGRRTELTLLRTGSRGGRAELDTAGAPLILGRGPEFVATEEAGGSFRVSIDLPPHASRIVVSTTRADGVPAAEPSVLVSPAGLAVPGEAFAPAGEFLREHFRNDPGRSTAIRKLVRLGDPAPGTFEAAFVPGGMILGPAR